MIILDENEHSRTIKTNIKATKEIIQKLMENDALSWQNAIILLGGLMMRKCCGLDEVEDLDPIKIGGATIKASTFVTSK